VPLVRLIDNTMNGKIHKPIRLVSMDTVRLGDWYIKASQFRGMILLTMFNSYNGEFVLQYVDNVTKANLIVEYVIEKGAL